MIATNCDRLEQYVGGQHLVTGTPDTADFASLTHPPVIVDLTHAGTGLPELHIDGYRGSTLVGSLDMSADPTRDRLALVVEDASIVGDGSDMTRFTFRAWTPTETSGPIRPGTSRSLAGPAALIAENPFSFQEYGGVGGGFIRSQPGTAGTVTVTAKPVGPSRARVRSALAGVLTPKGASARIARLPVRVAAATGSIKKAGRVAVKVKLTKRGRRLLEHAKRERLTARVSFTPIGRSRPTRFRVIELKH